MQPIAEMSLKQTSGGEVAAAHSNCCDGGVAELGRLHVLVEMNSEIGLTRAGRGCARPEGWRASARLESELKSCPRMKAIAMAEPEEMTERELRRAGGVEDDVRDPRQGGVGGERDGRAGGASER